MKASERIPAQLGGLSVFSQSGNTALWLHCGKVDHVAVANSGVVEPVFAEVGRC